MRWFPIAAILGVAVLASSMPILLEGWSAASRPVVSVPTGDAWRHEQARVIAGDASGPSNPSLSTARDAQGPTRFGSIARPAAEDGTGEGAGGLDVWSFATPMLASATPSSRGSDDRVAPPFPVGEPTPLPSMSSTPVRGEFTPTTPRPAVQPTAATLPVPPTTSSADPHPASTPRPTPDPTESPTPDPTESPTATPAGTSDDDQEREDGETGEEEFGGLGSWIGGLFGS